MTQQAQAQPQQPTIDHAHVQAVLQQLRRYAPQGAALRQDSRAVKVGDVFVAFSGDVHDGRDFIAAALKAGASCVLAEARGLVLHAPLACVIAVTDLKRLLGHIASAYYGQPSHVLDCIGITGTNGKTTVTHYTAQLLQALQGKPAGIIGTLGAGVLGAASSTGLTTPHASDVQRVLAQCAALGAGSACVEASSIGIVEGRLNGTRIRVAGFTNLTQDHLDYHGDMASYGAAKQALFDWAGLAGVVINTDDAFGAQLLKQVQATRPALRCISTGFGASAALRASGMRTLPDASQQFQLHFEGKTYASQLHALGAFNIHNVLTAVGCALALGYACADAVALIPRLIPVTGRMQRVLGADQSANPSTDQAPDSTLSPQQPLVIVDYAHTPDGLEQALLALRPVAQARGGQLHVVFGCGGDRDASKRPLMGAAALRLADRITVTNDNPRSEAPEAIAAQILENAATFAQVVATVTLDRAVAIAQAIARAAANDVVLIAGKGHETTQTVAAISLPFFDIEHARTALSHAQP
jgi:UDP-N-acetylmuramyl-tripeptide synthetase